MRTSKYEASAIYLRVPSLKSSAIIREIQTLRATSSSASLMSNGYMNTSLTTALSRACSKIQKLCQHLRDLHEWPVPRKFFISASPKVNSAPKCSQVGLITTRTLCPKAQARLTNDALISFKSHVWCVLGHPGRHASSQLRGRPLAPDPRHE